MGRWEICQEAVKLSRMLLNLQGTWLGTRWTHQEVTGKMPAEGGVLWFSLGSCLGIPKRTQKDGCGGPLSDDTCRMPQTLTGVSSSRFHHVDTPAPKWYKKQQSILESGREDSSSSSVLLRKQNVCHLRQGRTGVVLRSKGSVVQTLDLHARSSQGSPP